jgi:hypothetical protein
MAGRIETKLDQTIHTLMFADKLRLGYLYVDSSVVTVYKTYVLIHVELT